MTTLKQVELISHPRQLDNPKTKHYHVQIDNIHDVHIFWNEEHKGWLVKIGPEPFYNILPPWDYTSLISGRFVKPKDLLYKTVEEAFLQIVLHFEDTYEEKEIKTT